VSERLKKDYRQVATVIGIHHTCFDTYVVM
jgi:hypothetical protein